MKERENKGKITTTMEPKNTIPWKEKKYTADREEESLKQDIEDLNAWTNMIDGMNDQQLKGYIQNRPEELKTSKVHKSNVPRPKIQRTTRIKPSASNAGIIMASVWKFHKEDRVEELNVVTS